MIFLLKNDLSDPSELGSSCIVFINKVEAIHIEKVKKKGKIFYILALSVNKGQYTEVHTEENKVRERAGEFLLAAGVNLEKAFSSSKDMIIFDKTSQKTEQEKKEQFVEELMAKIRAD